MINIIYLVSRLKPAGPINQALNLLTGYDKQQVKALLVTLFDEEGKTWKQRFEEKDIEIICLNSDHKFLSKAAHKLDQIINERGVQVVHSSGLSADIVNSMLKSPILKVTTIRSHIGDLGEAKPFIARLYTRWRFKQNLKRMDVLVGCSYALQKSTEKDLGAKCSCVQNGVDIDKYTPILPHQKRKLRELLGIPQNKLILLTVGVLYKRKQTLFLTNVYLKANLPDSVLVIVGDGEEYDALKEIAKEHDNILMVGRKDDPCEYYQCADVFLSASLAEGLPNAVLEAMACGLPVLLSDIEPHSEILKEDPEAGALFKCGDSDDLFSGIRDLSNWSVSEKSTHALSVINSHFSKYITANNYVELYKQNL